MLLRKKRHVVEPRHRAVVLHYLAAQPDLLKPRQTAEIDSSLGMPGALEDAPLASLQREHMPRPAEIAWLDGRIHASEGRHRALVRRDASRRRNCIDRHGECRRMVVGIVDHHLRQIELTAPSRAHRHADKPFRMRRHEIHVFARRMACGANAVAFIFTVGIVRDENYFAVAERLDALLHRIEFHLHRLLHP